jgi:hypothetical protein
MDGKTRSVMTAHLLVLQFIDEGKLAVDDAVQLLETLVEEEAPEQELFPAWVETPFQIGFFMMQETSG